jgi:sortase A
VVRQLLRTLSSVLIVTGVLLVLDAVLTVVWQEPLSAFYQGRQQGRLDDELLELGRQQPTEAERRALTKLAGDDRKMAFLARALDRETKPGEPLGRIRMPSIGVSKVVVAGTDGQSLRAGPGHYPETPLPGLRGTVAIAGHRTTYGAPFRALDQLDRRDRVELVMPYGRFVYEVERTRIVPPSATYVTRKVAYDRLVLSACHPLYSAEQRIVVFARLVDAEPRGAALRA